MFYIQTKDKSAGNSSIKVEAFRKHIRKTRPHKHGKYLEIIYLSSGAGTHTVDHQTYSVEPPCLFIVRQEQVHCWNLTTEPNGFVILLKRSFFSSDDPELKQLLAEISRHTFLQLPLENNIGPTISRMMQATHGGNGDIQELTRDLFSQLLEVPGTEVRAARGAGNLYLALVDLLDQANALKQPVANYASLLQTTPQNLNAACRRYAGESASAVIASYVVSEAQRMLAYTSLTVAEVAYALQFKDPSHFVKYYKRHTGITPQVFRSALV